MKFVKYVALFAGVILTVVIASVLSIQSSPAKAAVGVTVTRIESASDTPDVIRVVDSETGIVCYSLDYDENTPPTTPSCVSGRITQK